MALHKRSVLLILSSFLLLSVFRSTVQRRLLFKHVESRVDAATGRCWREYSYVQQHVRSIASCPSATLFQLSSSSGENASSTYTRRTNVDSENTPDVHLFIVESLGQDAMRRNMHKTTEVLRKGRAIFFENFPGRCCGTRPNLIPLFFGAHGYTMSSNLTLDVNISRIEYEQNALWKIAQSNKRTTMYGSTACNVMFGCQKVQTADKYVFHDIRQQKSDFEFSFPYEAFYSHPNNTNCYQFEECVTPDQILRCESQGPYHHKFFDYYKKFRGTQTTPLFTITHLLEPHGFFHHEALDHHTSEFVDWILAKNNALLIFMGDHTNERDLDSTALAIVPPPYLQDVFEPLRLSRNFMLVHEDLHSFTKDVLLSVDWRESVKRLQQRLSSNDCDLHTNLQSCFCPNVARTSVVYAEDMKTRAVNFINEQRRRAPTCLEFTARDAEVKAVHESDIHVSFELHFASGAIFQATFSSRDTFKTRQLTRYASQAFCTPDGVHPEFCICNEELFLAAQLRPNKRRATL